MDKNLFFGGLINGGEADLRRRSQAEILHIQSIYKSLGGEIPTPLTTFANFQELAKVKIAPLTKNKKTAKATNTTSAVF